MGWNNAKVGAGGLITGLSFSSDGTLVARADVFGGYIYDKTIPNPGNAGGTGAWKQLITTTTLAGYASFCQWPFNAADGLYEIQIAWSNSNIIYMVWKGFIWISQDKGGSWTQQTSFSQDGNCTGNIAPRVYCDKMAVDPVNPDVVYLVTFNNGVWKTTNGTSGGSATWSKISTATIPANDFTGIGAVAIDPSSSNSSSPTRKSVVYVNVGGSGTYKSTDGGVTWASVSGGPGTAQFREMVVSQNGTLFAVDYSAQVVWRLVGSTWSNITPATANDANSISLHPTVADHLIVWYYRGDGVETTTATSGTTPTMWTYTSTSIMTAADTPMIGTLLKQFTTSGTLRARWDPSDTSKIWAPINQGVWQISYPLTTPLIMNSVSAGIEEVVANDIVVPPGAGPLFFGWDVGIIPQTDLTKYALAQAWNTASFLCFGSGGDYASNDPTFVCGLVGQQGSAEVSGYSTSAGAVGTWTAFSSFPAGVPTSHFGGCIAASTDQKMIWVTAQAGQPFYTSNRGSSWATISGLPNDDGWDHNSTFKRHIAAADRVTADKFYLQCSTNSAVPGTYVITNSGATVVYNANSIDGGAASRLRAVPGNAGHLFFTAGPVGSGGAPGDPASSWPHSTLFYYSTNSGTTWTDVSALSSNAFTIREVWSFGFGAIAPGKSYPVIYIYGFVAVGSSPLPAGSTPAFWKSEDQGVTWVQFGSQFPIGWPEYYATVNGDPNIYGRVYAGGTGTGWIYYDISGPATPAIGFSVITDSNRRPTRMIGY